MLALSCHQHRTRRLTPDTFCGLNLCFHDPAQFFVLVLTSDKHALAPTQRLGITNHFLAPLPRL